MNRAAREEGKTVLLTSQGLLKIKSRARRSGIWYETLSTTERAIVDLTIKCVEKVRSPTLTKTIKKIIGKITQTLEKGFIQKAQEIGSSFAKQIVGIAQKWGNKKAPNWEHDEKFVNFLGIMALNT